jgi:hypothetical protein
MTQFFLTLNQGVVKTGDILDLHLFLSGNLKNCCLVEEDCLGVLVVHLLDVPEDVLLGDNAEESAVMCDLE